MYSSSREVRAVLARKKEYGRIDPINFAILTMNYTERGYNTYEIKDLSVINPEEVSRIPTTVPSFRVTHWLSSSDLRLRKKDVHGQIIRWMDFLSEYDFEVKYRPGKGNKAAYYLSRLSVGDPPALRDEEGHLTCQLNVAKVPELFQDLDPTRFKVDLHFLDFPMK